MNTKEKIKNRLRILRNKVWLAYHDTKTEITLFFEFPDPEERRIIKEMMKEKFESDPEVLEYKSRVIYYGNAIMYFLMAAALYALENRKDDAQETLQEGKEKVIKAKWLMLRAGKEIPKEYNELTELGLDYFEGMSQEEIQSFSDKYNQVWINFKKDCE